MELIGGIEFFRLKLTPSTEVDVVTGGGYEVFAVPESELLDGDFQPSSFNRAYKGPNSDITVAVSPGTWAVKAAAYDVFGDTDLNYTPVMSCQVISFESNALVRLLGRISSDQLTPYLYAGIEYTAIKLAFSVISWAQFAVFDNFLDESKRLAGEAGNRALVLNNSLIQGDSTPNKQFRFTSHVYQAMTTVHTGTMALVEGETYRDLSGKWYVDELKALTLVDGGGSMFTVESNTANTITLLDDLLTPAAGPYLLRTENPGNMVATCSYQDSTLDGFGHVRLEVSFNGGLNWQLLLDTQTGHDETGGTVLIDYPGAAYQARVTLINDALGGSPVFSDFLVVTDPSPWRY